MNLLSSIFTGKINEKFSKDEIAKMLKTTPEALEAFENRIYEGFRHRTKGIG